MYLSVRNSESTPSGFPSSSVLLARRYRTSIYWCLGIRPKVSHKLFLSSKLCNCRWVVRQSLANLKNRILTNPYAWNGKALPISTSILTNPRGGSIILVRSHQMKEVTSKRCPVSWCWLGTVVPRGVKHNNLFCFLRYHLDWVLFWYLDLSASKQDLHRSFLFFWEWSRYIFPVK